MSVDSGPLETSTPSSPTDHFLNWVSCEPGAIIASHPALAPFARWLWHLWLYADLEPTGHVPSYREGVDEITGIEVDDAAASLPILPQTPQSPDMDTPVPSTSTSGFGFSSTSDSLQPNVLFETIGVIRLHFFLPPHLLSLLHPAHITAHKFLTVRIPRIWWYSSPLQLTKVDIFRALCGEISSASVENEAPDDGLIYPIIGTLRRRAGKGLRGIMKEVECRSVDIPYGKVAGKREEDFACSNAHEVHVRSCRSRRLYCYDPHEHELGGFGYSGPKNGSRRAKEDDISANQGGALILYQQDPDGCQLGVAVWEPAEMSLIPSYTVLFYFPRSCSPFGRAEIPSPPHSMEEAIEAAQQYFSQDYPF